MLVEPREHHLAALPRVLDRREAAEAEAQPAQLLVELRAPRRQPVGRLAAPPPPAAQLVQSVE